MSRQCLVGIDLEMGPRSFFRLLSTIVFVVRLISVCVCVFLRCHVLLKIGHEKTISAKWVILTKWYQMNSLSLSLCLALSWSRRTNKNVVLHLACPNNRKDIIIKKIRHTTWFTESPKCFLISPAEEIFIRIFSIKFVARGNKVFVQINPIYSMCVCVCGGVFSY